MAAGAAAALRRLARRVVGAQAARQCSSKKPPVVFMVAGEPSGDAIGAGLIRELGRQYGSTISFVGVGGSEMQAAGLRSLFPMQELTVAGFAEAHALLAARVSRRMPSVSSTSSFVARAAQVLPRFPRLLVRYMQTLNAARSMSPRIVIGIDFKGFNLRLLKALGTNRAGLAKAMQNNVAEPLEALGRGPFESDYAPKAEVPGVGPFAPPALVQYVGPSVWAFPDAASRAARLAGWLDHLLVILPFEEELFSRAGVRCTFVGHPSFDRYVASDEEPPISRATAAAGFRNRHDVKPEARVLCLLPGSRPQEVRALLPIMLSAVTELERDIRSTRAAHPRESPLRAAEDASSHLVVVIPVAVAELYSLVHGILRRANFGFQCILISRSDRHDAYAASELALAACGTVNIELAVARVPQIALYRTSLLTRWILRSVLRPSVRHATLPNIIAGRECIPEFLFERCEPKPIAQAAVGLLTCPRSRHEQVDAMTAFLSALRARPPNLLPLSSSAVAASTLLRYLPNRSQNAELES